MMTCKAFCSLAGILATVALAPVAAAQSASYTTLSSFNAATTTSSVIDYNTFGAGFYGNVFGTGGVTFSSTSNIFTQANNAYGTGTFVTIQGAAPTIVNFTLLNATTGFGFSYQSGAAFSLVVNGKTYNFGGTTYPVLGFAGITDAVAFRTFTLTDAGGGIDIDNVRLASLPVTSAVPEMSTWAMMLVGVGGMSIALRRRNSRASITSCTA